jgi:hypothetical protein
VATAKPFWISLCDASYRLQIKFGVSGLEMVERAVRSGEVPVRAYKDQLASVPARIEKEITSDMRLEIGRSSILCDQFSRIVCFDIEISWPKCVEYCKANLIPTARPALTYRSAPTVKIIKVIRTVYDEAEAFNQKAPNIRQIVEPVQNALRSEGLHASGSHIQKLARSDEFKKRRRKPGATVKSDRNSQRI